MPRLGRAGQGLMASFDPGYGATEVSEEERAALTPYALQALGEPVLKAALYDIEQTLQDRVGSALVDEIRSGTLTSSEILTDHFVRQGLGKVVFHEVSSSVRGRSGLRA